MVDKPFYRLKNIQNQNFISVYKTEFQIGRSTINDLCLNQNPYISSCHCTFEYENGHVFIRDTSSNGTLINRTNKITKTDPRVELQTDDTVHLVFRKDEPEFSKSNNSCRNFRIHSFRCCFST